MRSKSNDGDGSKRPGESSLRDSNANTTNTDVFTEFLKSEDCAAISYSCIKKLEEEMKKFFRCVKKQNTVKLKANKNGTKRIKLLTVWKVTSLIWMRGLRQISQYRSEEGFK